MCFGQTLFLGLFLLIRPGVVYYQVEKKRKQNKAKENRTEEQKKKESNRVTRNPRGNTALLLPNLSYCIVYPTQKLHQEREKKKGNSKVLTNLFLNFLILDHLHNSSLRLLTILSLEDLHLSSNKEFLVRSCIHTRLSWLRCEFLGRFLSNITCLTLGVHWSRISGVPRTETVLLERGSNFLFLE